VRCAAAALLAALALAACARQGAPELVLSGARVEARGTGAVLLVECDWRPSAAMLEALDHGVVLGLRLTLSRQHRGLVGWRDAASVERHLELRWFPLTRQYQLRDLEQGSVRSFGVRASALAALGHYELPLSSREVMAAAAERQRLVVDFDAGTLPGALRLPALVQGQWRQQAAERTWFDSPAG
jgi:hypothetical protein